MLSCKIISQSQRLRRRGNTSWAKGTADAIGHAKGKQRAALAMGIDWMTGDELTQAIPPRYTKFIGEQLIRYVRPRAVEAEVRR